MPRYFFNVRDGDELIEDCNGTEVADLEAATTEVLARTVELIAEGAKQKIDLKGQVFEITDENGEIVAAIPLADVLS